MRRIALRPSTTTEKGSPMADDRPAKILAAIGGADNVVEIEPCITRLRCELENGSLVDEAALKAVGAHGVIRAGNVVQVIVGPEADTIASDIEDLM
jgi:N-acetylglucosamine PTS system EIIB component